MFYKAILIVFWPKLQLGNLKIENGVSLPRENPLKFTIGPPKLTNIPIVNANQIISKYLGPLGPKPTDLPSI